MTPQARSSTGRRLLLPDAPPIANLRFRLFAGPDDYEAMAALVREVSIADANDYVPTAEQLRIEAESDSGFDPASGHVLAEVAGRLVAFGAAFVHVRDGVSVYATTGTVAPGWRRRRLGRAILRHNERVLASMATRRSDPGGRVLGAWASDREPGSDELLRSEGYRAVRHGFSMVRDLAVPLPEAPMPAGLEIRVVRPEHHRAIFDADAEAFRDHWDHREMTDGDFDGLFATPGLDTALWRVAWDGHEVAGSVQAFVWTAENEALRVRRGWLERISVRRPWRRRGLASALIVSALAGLRDAGLTEAMLGVDGENLTGALGLYESLGFRVKGRSTAYRKDWPAS